MWIKHCRFPLISLWIAIALPSYTDFFSFFSFPATMHFSPCFPAIVCFFVFFSPKTFFPRLYIFFFTYIFFCFIFYNRDVRTNLSARWLIPEPNFFSFFSPKTFFSQLYFFSFSTYTFFFVFLFCFLKSRSP